MNFGQQPTGLIFASITAIREIENERISKQSFALAQFATDYFASKMSESKIEVSRYLPFSKLSIKPKLPITEEEERIIRACADKIPAKFYGLYFEDFG